MYPLVVSYVSISRLTLTALLLLDAKHHHEHESAEIIQVARL